MELRINDKLDKIIETVSEIKKIVAIQDYKTQAHDERIKNIEQHTEQYKRDRYKIIGGAGVLGGIIAWISKHI